MNFDVTAADGRALLAVAERDWSRPIPHCPDWDAAALVGHMGAILGWIAMIVTTGERVARGDRETPPAEPDELAPWFSAHLDRTLDVVTTTSPDAPVWTFSTLGEQRVGWWRRRLAVELAIHRWDAQHAAHAAAAPPPDPVDRDVAAAGIAEFLTEFLPGLLAAPTTEAVRGTLHLHAADSPSEWWIDLDDRQAAHAQVGHKGADTALRGTTSDLLLWLTNRGPTNLHLIGPADNLAGWSLLRR